MHSTAALTTIEFEPGALADLVRALSVLAPDDAEYAHNTKWGDGNGRSHVKAALVGPPSRSLSRAVDSAAGHGSRSFFSNWMQTQAGNAR